jgi:hypothetical protein
MRSTFTQLLLWGSLAAMLPAAPALAQSESEGGRGEVFGFAGGYFGEGMSMPVFGGGAAGRATPWLRVFGEGYHMRSTFTIGGRDVLGRATGFDAGAHFLLPVSSSRVQPFASVGTGFGLATASLGSISASESVLMLVVGGGADINVSRKWGLRPEIRVYSFAEVRATAGFFYRF